MKKNFHDPEWKKYLPEPVCGEHPEYGEFYMRAWELARARVRDIPGMPQSPYMDEAVCDSQVWIWDSCFMSLFCKFAPEVFPGIETLNNFYEVLYGGRLLPVIIPTEREPAWTQTTPGVPVNIKIHLADNPPLFAWAEYENALMHGDLDYLRDLMYSRQVLQKHYAWIEGLKEQTTLPGVFHKTYLIAEDCGYKWEGGTSGMDNTPRGRLGEKADRDRPNNPDMLWIDAICQQALSARTIARLFRLLDDSAAAEEWEKKFREKQSLINGLYWDSEDRFYYDIDVNTHAFYKVMSAASFWALTAGAASEEQAAAMAEYIADPHHFGGPVPLTTLSRSDSDYDPLGQYWRGAMWLPTAYAALKGLAEYKYYGLAHEAGLKIFRHMLATYHDYEPHTIWECYNPEEPKPATSLQNKKIVRPDFCGWSALGPISVYIEYVLGFHTVNAFENTVEWAKPDTFRGEIGIRNLRFGNVVTDIVADGGDVRVTANAPYTLKINGKAYAIDAGENVIRV